MICSFNLTAQIKFEGVVKDSIGNVLELANVIAINQETNALESYTFTNDKGYFNLALRQNEKFKLQISYVGMKSFEDFISTQTSDISRDYTLQFEANLETVELNYKLPVSIKGDTLSYNADSFKSGSERKLEDVLEKLPGVEINEEGQVEVEGKVVNKLMVNGKDFFDGDTKIATKNIPSDAVDKIQVLRNYTEVNQLRSVTNNQDNFALNIKLKEGKERFWFGNITAGGGKSDQDSHYIIQPKLFYYSPKFSLNFIGDLNNTGQVALTPRDIRSFGGGFGFRPPSRSSGTNINLGNNDLGFLTNQNNAKEIKYKLAATNFSYSPKKSLDISGFLIFNVNDISSRQLNIRKYTDEDLEIPDERIESNNVIGSDQGLLKFSTTYKPNRNNQLDYDFLGRLSKDVQNQNYLSSVVGNTLQINEVTPYSINQNLNYYYTLNEKNIFALEMQHLIKNDNPFYNALLENDPNNNDAANPDERDAFDTTAEVLGFNNALNFYNINQNRRVKSNQLDAKLDYYYIINTKSNLNLTFGTIISRQEFNSNMFQFLNEDISFNPTPIINGGLAENDTEYNFSDIYLGFHYRLKAGKFTLTPGFSLHAYGNKNSQFGTEIKNNFFRFLPDFETRIQLKKSESLTFRYEMRNQFTDITKLAEGLVFNTFDRIQYGEPELQNALSHNLSLLYSSFNLFNYTNVFGRLAYSKNSDQIRSLTNFENVIATNTFFNSSFADENASAFGRIQRTFGKVRASLNVNFNYSKINQFIQNRKSLNERFTQNYRPGLRTNFKIAPNISINYQYSISTNNQGTSKTTFYTNAPSVELDAYIWKSVTFKTDYTFTKQRLKGNPSESFKTFNASLAYRNDRDSKWEFELKATNLLNIESRLNNSSNNLFVATSETFIQPRLITFRLRYIL